MISSALAQTSRKPAMGRASSWTAERLQVVYDRYVIAGEPAAVVAGDLGVTPQALRRRVADEPSWKRDPMAQRRNHAAATGGKAVRDPTAPPKLREPHRAPVNFSAPPKLDGALGERIVAAIQARPLSASSIACLVDSKEHFVALQLVALEAAGAVVAGPADHVGLRHRLWRCA